MTGGMVGAVPVISWTEDGEPRAARWHLESGTPRGYR